MQLEAKAVLLSTAKTPVLLQRKLLRVHTYLFFDEVSVLRVPVLAKLACLYTVSRFGRITINAIGATNAVQGVVDCDPVLPPDFPDIREQ